MAKLKVMRLEIVASTQDKNRIIDYIQRKGAVEVSAPDEEYGFRAGNASDKVSELTKQLAVVKECETALRKLAPQSKPITAMLEPRKDLTPEDYEQKAAEFGDTMKRCERIVQLYKQLETDEADIVRQKTLIAQFAPWLNLDIPLHSGTSGSLYYLTGSIKKRLSREDVLKILAQGCPENDAVDVQIISSDEICTCFIVFCLKPDAQQVETVLRAEGFQRAPEYPGETAAERTALAEQAIAEDEQRAQKIRTAISNEVGFYEKLEFAKDYIGINIDKYKSFSLVAEKGNVFYIKGFASQKDANSIKKYIEKEYEAAVEVSEPAGDEDVPVILSNNFFSAPLEGITGMYSLPSGVDIDPTGVMAFFYYFFFGMMLSDAGYGMLMVLATGGVLLLKKNIEKSLRNMCKMYLFCGLSTVFWGAMYGSWFGDAASVIAVNFFGKEEGYTPGFFKPLWTDAVTDLMNVLIVCFIFGLVHLFVGVLLKGITDWKNGHKFDAFCDTVPTFLTIIGIAPVFFGLFLQDTMPENYSALGTFIFNLVKNCDMYLSKVNIPILIVGLLLVVGTAGRQSKSIAGKIGGGLYEIYNLVGGYLGDVLSYARLLALGLATGVIAQVMNMLGTLPSNPVLKAIVFVIVFIVGHVANLAINLIGAYVHTNRLQYVEFFGKFYEGGGRAFVPLKANTEYYKFKEDDLS